MAQEEVKPARTVLAIQRASRASHIPGDARLRAWARAALSRPAVVTLRYVAATEGRRLNREFRGKDYATNVLTFIYGRDPAGALSGDVVICAPVVAREAREQGKDVAAHHAHLLVHGLLHLQGHDHERRAEAARMERLEREILARLGFPDPYAGG
ncbi:MAG: rRNA maturation RNase YbeY [Betaproteobacteria bacterium]|nr:rRNA maturation RNase YbeY [Betaproteobacteria bacterium]PWB60915.1 MAG: rRNA maturation RNase YbeY [Betaproteobacteria bacterium]